MHKKLIALVKKDDALPERAHRLTWLDEFRTSKIYDRLPHSFCDEKEEGTGKYIPLAQRSPSVRLGIPQVIVKDSTALLFSEGHFPSIETEGSNTLDEVFGALVKETNLRTTMLDAAVRGSIGSIVIMFRLLKGRVFWKVMSTRYLTPEWDEEAPDQLVRVTERYKVTGRQLVALGYTIAPGDMQREFWFQRIWDTTAEVWFLPWPVIKVDGDASKYPIEARDNARSKDHGLGFVPMVWVKNLPGGDDIDGACTFEPAIDTCIEGDYQMSQAGRGLKYASDPTMHIREPAYQDMGATPLIKGAANAIVTSLQGDVKMLEISGSAAAAVQGYVDQLRISALELCGGNRTSPEKLSGAQSGRAMEMMNQGLIFLADMLRTSYGEGALLSLLRMVVEANKKLPVTIDGTTYEVGALNQRDTGKTEGEATGTPAGGARQAEGIKIILKWPPWYAPTMADHQAQSLAISTYRDAGVISQETAVRQVAHDFDIEDVPAEIAKIKAERAEAMKEEVEKQRLLTPPPIASQAPANQNAA